MLTTTQDHKKVGLKPTSASLDTETSSLEHETTKLVSDVSELPGLWPGLQRVHATETPARTVRRQKAKTHCQDAAPPPRQSESLQLNCCSDPVTTVLRACELRL